MKLVTMEKSNVDIVRLGGKRGERGREHIRGRYVL